MPSMATPFPIPSVTTSAAPGIIWTQVVGGNDVLLMDVAAFPGGVVAVGGARPVTRAPSPGLETSGPAGPGDCRTRNDPVTCAGPMVWTLAPDGRQQLIGPIGSDGGALQRVAWTGSSLVAIGCRWQPETEADTCARPIVWTSPDGVSWSDAAVPPTPLGAAGILLGDVAALRGDVVLGGCLTEPYGDIAGVFCSAAAVWRSPDGGGTWTEPELPDGPGSNSWVTTLGTDGATLVAGGFAEASSSERIWTSTDAGAWALRTVEPGGADTVAGIVSSDGAWLAVGDIVDDGAIWTSPDGADWKRDAAMSGARRIETAVALDDGFAGFGSSDGIPVIWTSPDGETWLSSATDFRLQDPELAVLGDRLVAIGQEGAFLSDPITPGVDIP